MFFISDARGDYYVTSALIGNHLMGTELPALDTRLPEICSLTNNYYYQENSADLQSVEIFILQATIDDCFLSYTYNETN